MKAIIQRVNYAKVEVNNKIIGQINQGIVLFLGVEKQDDKEKSDALLNKIVNYRIFSDENDKMNLSLLDVKGDLLIISQFTLLAETNKGLRPSFSKAGDPILSKNLYNYMIKQANKTPLKIQSGEFAADMQVSLQNNGPVTFNLTT